ncbi:hypothetical protein [Escherichia coli]|uniref:hypothetical protein n=1 Tax=Escherichia coli TaxID=562 RepID=UPI003C6D40F6
MSTITKEFTKEQLTRIIESADEVITALAGTNDDIHPDNSTKMCAAWDDLNDRNAPPSVVKKLAELALAGMEAEPVAYMHHSGQVVTREECCDDKIFAICCKVETPLYAAPQLPQPAVPDEIDVNDPALDTHRKWIAEGWNKCRAAMLQSDGTLTNEGTMQLSGNSEQIEPVSNRDELPLDYLQGHKDGLEWAAQLAEANHPQTGDWLYDDPIELARAIRKGPDMPTAQAGNSPVIGIDLASEPDRSVEVRYFAPPGYVMVPKEPTEAMMLHKSGCKDHPWDDPECVMRQTRRLVWAHMLEAAAQQEVKSSLEHGMQRYAGAMQKLADAGD